MSHRISDSRLESMHAFYSGKLRQNKDKPDGEWLFVECNLRELCYVLDELRVRRGRNVATQYGELTKWMIASKVGDVTIIPPKTQSAITTCRATARKAMKNPEARWRAENTPDGDVKVERMPDGAAHQFGKPKNPVPALLAAMEVGEVKVIDYGNRRFPAKFKVLARAIMKRSEPDWRYETLATGKQRVTRTR